MSTSVNSFLQKRNLTEIAQNIDFVCSFGQVAAGKIRKVALQYLHDKKNLTVERNTSIVNIPSAVMEEIFEKSVAGLDHQLDPVRLSKILEEMRRFCDQTKVDAFSFSREEYLASMRPGHQILMPWKDQFQNHSYRNYLEKIKDHKVVDISSSETELSCYQFALSQQGISAPNFYEETEHIADVLRQVGLYPVVKPESGDLVLFLQNGKVLHMGIVQKDGKILSKYGSVTPFAMIHPLGDTPKSYGDQIIYFREPTDSPGNLLLLVSVALLSMLLYVNCSTRNEL